MENCGEYKFFVPETQPIEDPNHALLEDPDDHFVTQNRLRLEVSDDDSDHGGIFDPEMLTLANTALQSSPVSTIPNTFPDETLDTENAAVSPKCSPNKSGNDSIPSTNISGRILKVKIVSQGGEETELNPTPFQPSEVGDFHISAPDAIPSGAISAAENISSYEDDEVLASALIAHENKHKSKLKSVCTSMPTGEIDPDTIDFRSQPHYPFDKATIDPSKDQDLDPNAAPSKTNVKVRFHKASTKEIQNLQRNSKAEKTHVQTSWGAKMFKEWCEFSGYDRDFEHLAAEELGNRLKQFYGEVRTKDGGVYSRSSLLCIRAAIHRHITGPPFDRNINIMNDSDFTAANSVMSGTIKKKKRDGEDRTERHSAISAADVRLLYSTGTLSESTPTNLLYKVFFELCLYFGRRGREGLRQIKKTSIVFKKDPQGNEFATLDHNPFEKNHGGMNHHQSEHIQIMYTTNTSDCPLKSLRLYLEKLNPEQEAFIQQPKMKNFSKSPIWYTKSPIGINTLGKMMAQISVLAGLSQVYTNHCIRATTITSLRDARVDILDIASVTGHRCAASINSYSTTNESMRKTMSDKLSIFLGKSTAPDQQSSTTADVNNHSAAAADSSKSSAAHSDASSVVDYSPKKRRSPVEEEDPPVGIVAPSPHKAVTVGTPHKKPSISLPTRSSPRLKARTLSTQEPLKSAKQLSFGPETGDEQPTKMKVTAGQTIIIEGGSNIHIHYH